jgi:glycosyltransferase involved in cell wall biosynthesis
MKYPKISVITATFNSAKTLEATIQSIVAQQYPKLEFIIIDGRSTDGTLEIIKNHAQYITRWVSGKDRGLYDAMNKGIELSTGEMVAFLNSDDVYINSPLQAVAEKARKNPEADVVYANAIIESNVRPTYLYKSIYPITKNDFWRTPIIHPAMFTKRSALKKVGCFSINYRISADYELILKLFLAKCTFCYCDATWASMQGGGLSEQKWVLGMKEIYSILRTNHQLNAFLATMLVWCYIKTKGTMFLEKNNSLKGILDLHRKLLRKKYKSNSA